MPNVIPKVSYAYVTAASKPGEAARVSPGDSRLGFPPAVLKRSCSARTGFMVILTSGFTVGIVHSWRARKGAASLTSSRIGQQSGRTGRHSKEKLKMHPTPAQETAAIDAERKAFGRRQEAFLGMNRHWKPYGDGLPPQSILNEYDAANAAWIAAKAEIDQLTALI